MKKIYVSPVVKGYNMTTKYTIATGSTVGLSDDYADSTTDPDGDALGKVREVLDGLW